MFVLNRVTGEMEWMPRSLCFADDGGDESGASDGGEDGEGGNQEGAESGGDDSQQTQASGTGTDTVLTDQETPKQEAQPDWRATIEDPDLRRLSERYESATAMAKAVSDLRRETATRIKPLGDNPSDEELSAYRKQIGVPETAEGYEFKMPEGRDLTEADKVFHKKMSEAMHGVHISAAQAAALNEALNAYTTDMAAAQEKALAEASDKAVETLKKDWGADYERNTEYARRAAKQFGDDGFKQWIETKTVDGTPLGDHPAFLKAFAQIGRRAGEEGIDIGVSDADRATIEDRITALRKEIQEALDRGDHARASELDKQERALHAKTGGTNRNIGPGPGNVAVA